MTRRGTPGEEMAETRVGLRSGGTMTSWIVTSTTENKLVQKATAKRTSIMLIHIIKTR